MATMRMELDVELEGGQRFQVVADQRDFARFEVQPFGYPVGRLADESNVSIGMLRFLAWSAATRQGLTALPWEQFDAQLVEAMPPEDEPEDAAAADADDPGRPAPSATPTSP